MQATVPTLRRALASVSWRTAPIRGAAARAEKTLLIEWPEGEAKPTKYWRATVDENISFRALVDLAKMRWHIERDYRELKQEIGLGHYEGRGRGSIIVVRCASRLTDSWSPNGRRFPPLIISATFLQDAHETCPSR
jgi:SRSO17 transposase